MAIEFITGLEPRDLELSSDPVASVEDILTRLEEDIELGVITIEEANFYLKDLIGE
jgi:hypothetical protein